MTAASPPAVRMRGIVKRFEASTALDGVDFDLRRGEIHALLGENGAGKSTLMRLLAGLIAPDSGTLELDGAPRHFRSARESTAAGIGMVHQHFALVDNLTVAENLALALPKQTPFFLPKRDLAVDALAVAERLGWKLDPSAKVWQLPVGMQQRLEIVKVLAADPQILIFDEPTAVLAPIELEELFGVLEQLRADGHALVFISHKLSEVLRLSDRITVLRRGRNAGTLAREATDAADLAQRMMGAFDVPDVQKMELQHSPMWALKPTGATVEDELQHSPLRALTPDQPADIDEPQHNPLRALTSDQPADTDEPQHSPSRALISDQPADTDEPQHSPLRALIPNQPLPEGSADNNAHKGLCCSSIEDSPEQAGAGINAHKGLRRSPLSDVVLTITGLRVRDERGLEAVTGIELEVRAGEIVGIAGVDGNGQGELAEAVAGLRPVTGGVARIDGRVVSAATRPEVGFIPQDRRRSGIVPGMSVRENLVLELALTPEGRRGPWLRWDWLNHAAGEMRRDFDVRAGSLEQGAETLSGGNQQKIVIARALRKSPRLIVALNPTRGLDVNATAYVHEQLRRRREEGAAVLLISTELEEVIALSDRVGVLYEGRLMGIVPPDTSRDTLGLMMGGQLPTAAIPA